jgi:hypothetical protein
MSVISLHAKGPVVRGPAGPGHTGGAVLSHSLLVLTAVLALLPAGCSNRSANGVAVELEMSLKFPATG